MPLLAAANPPAPLTCIVHPEQTASTARVPDPVNATEFEVMGVLAATPDWSVKLKAAGTKMACQSAARL
jgi:hypothetical protein